MSYELSWHQRLLDGSFSYSLNLYYIDADNIIQTIQRQNVNTGELRNKGIEVEASWKVNEHWSLNTNHSYLDQKHPVVGAPEYMGFLGANYRQGRWSVAAGLQQVSGLYTAVLDNEEKENFTLLNVTIDYQLAPLFKLWLKGDNLLAQKYEINAGYPMPKATFMAGISLDF